MADKSELPEIPRIPSPQEWAAERVLRAEQERWEIETRWEDRAVSEECMAREAVAEFRRKLLLGEALFGEALDQPHTVFKGRPSVAERVVALFNTSTGREWRVLDLEPGPPEREVSVRVQPVPRDLIASLSVPPPSTWVLRKERTEAELAKRAQAGIVRNEAARNEALARAYVGVVAARLAAGAPIFSHGTATVCQAPDDVCRWVLKLLREGGWRGAELRGYGSTCQVILRDPLDAVPLQETISPEAS
jgi:hypothetical protein